MTLLFNLNILTYLAVNIHNNKIFWARANTKSRRSTWIVGQGAVKLEEQSDAKLTSSILLQAFYTKMILLVTCLSFHMEMLLWRSAATINWLLSDISSKCTTSLKTLDVSSEWLKVTDCSTGFRLKISISLFGDTRTSLELSDENFSWWVGLNSPGRGEIFSKLGVFSCTWGNSSE